MFQLELEAEQLGRVREELRDKHAWTGKERRTDGKKSTKVTPGSTAAGLRVDYDTG